MAELGDILRKYALGILGVILAIFGSVKDALSYALGLFSSGIPSPDTGILASVPFLVFLLGIALVVIDLVAIRPRIPNYRPEKIRELKITWPQVFDTLDHAPKEFYTEGEYLIWLRHLNDGLYVASIQRAGLGRLRFQAMVSKDIRKYAISELKSRRRYRTNPIDEFLDWLGL